MDRAGFEFARPPICRSGRPAAPASRSPSAMHPKAVLYQAELSAHRAVARRGIS